MVVNEVILEVLDDGLAGWIEIGDAQQDQLLLLAALETIGDLPLQGRAAMTTRDGQWDAVLGSYRVEDGPNRKLLCNDLEVVRLRLLAVATIAKPEGPRTPT